MIENIKTVKEAIYDERFNIFIQMIIAFLSTFILSPFGKGIFYFVISIIIYEIILLLYKRNDVLKRSGIILSSILGWIVGRTMFSCDVLDNNCPFK
jgi:hypothetical protein